MLSNMTAANNPRGQRIREARKAKFGSQDQLAAAIAERGVVVTRGAVGNWERGLGITMDNLGLVAELTGFRLEYLATGALPKHGGSPSIPDAAATSTGRHGPGFSESPPFPASALSGPAQPMQSDDRRRDNPLPVWASAEGGEEGAMLITTGPIDWIPRPRTLQVQGAFAVYLIGDSMSPAYDHGDQLYIHPHRPAEGGQDCLFVQELEDGTLLGLAKRLVRARPDRWRVRQFNPAKDFELDRRKWRKAWVIVGKMNRG